MTATSDFVPVAVTSRSGFDESVHFGAMVGLNFDGSIEFAIGNPSALIYPRSSNKPMQAVAMVRAGLSLPPHLLALVCASHDGSAAHLEAARQILASAGLTPAALGNTTDLPLDDEQAELVLRAGGGRTALQMNCSGKHSGMLATCVANGWPLDNYMSPSHPLQIAITETIDELAVETHAHIGVDGCGAPAHVMTLIGLARSFRAIATGLAGPQAETVHTAMTSAPEMVGGPTRDVTVLMQNIPFLMAKDGADGVYAAALPDGRALALKIADGGDRARPPVFVAGLAALGIDISHVAPLIRQTIKGHGHEVGVVRSLVP